MNVAALLRIVWAGVVLGCVAPVRPAQTAAEFNPVEPGEISRREAAKNARQIQEQYSHRLSIPGAVVPEVERAGAAVVPASQPVEPSFLEGKEDYVRFGIIGALFSILVVTTVYRSRRDAEIRALRGGYLSDGTEVASFKMPEIFAPQVLPKPGKAAPIPAVALAAGTTPLKDPLDVFLEKSAEHLAAIRKAVQDFGRAGERAEAQQAMQDLAQHLGTLKAAANFWTVRPVWQLSSALELLVKRVVEKPDCATPSTMRTILAAVDLLHTLCARNIRPELILDPPVQILSVDDNPLCLRAVIFALQKISLTPDVAENGRLAVEKAAAKAYDVIFMDIQMPEMDGLTACQRIHESTLNGDTPVVFVTIQSDFHTRAQSNVLGGSDLMAKPFLVFELAVKALTFIMRKRLGLCRVAKPVTRPQAEPATPAASVAPSTEAAIPAPRADGRPVHFRRKNKKSSRPRRHRELVS